MPLLPPIPAWSSAHPIIVHFPIALLLLTPLPLAAALLIPKKRPTFTAAAAITAILGAAFALLATASGDAAEDATKGIPGADAVLDRHEDLAELARNLALGLAAALGVWSLLAPRIASRTITAAASLLFLLFSSAVAITLANAAHEGGRLVHELGVRAMPAAGPSSAPATRDHDDD